MSRCSDCGFGWRWRLADGRLKCRRCGRRWRARTLWGLLLNSRVTAGLVQLFVWGMPGFTASASRSLPAAQRRNGSIA